MSIWDFWRKRQNRDDGKGAGEPEGAPSSRAQNVAPDIDQLALAARESGKAEDSQRLWQTVMSLEGWHFVMASPPGKENVTPREIAGALEGKLFVFAFTTAGKAADFARKQGLWSGSGSPPCTVMSVKEAVGRLEARKNDQPELFGVLFDHGSSSFFAPIENLRPMLDASTEKPSGQPNNTPEDDREAAEEFIAQVDMQLAFMGDETSADLLHRLFMRLPRWYFLCDAERPTAPHVGGHEGKPCLLAFSHQSQALGSARQMGLLNPDGTANVFGLETAKALAWLPQFDAIGVKKVLFNPVAQPVPLEVERLVRLGGGGSH